MNDNLVKAALVARLSADSTLTALLGDGTAGIYDGLAKQGAIAPWIVFTKPAGVPSYTMGQRAYDDQLWQIKAVTVGTSNVTAGSIVARVDALLDDLPLTLGTGTNMCLRRSFDVPEFIETVDGVRRFNKGANYRLYIQ